jgi:DUF2934 family protein
MATRPDRASRAKKRLSIGAAEKPADVNVVPMSSVDSGTPPVDCDQRRAMIAEAAYFRAEQRGFEPGHELEDWCAAEGEIDTLPTRGGPPPFCGV